MHAANFGSALAIGLDLGREAIDDLIVGAAQSGYWDPNSDWARVVGGDDYATLHGYLVAQLLNPQVSLLIAFDLEEASRGQQGCTCSWSP